MQGRIYIGVPPFVETTFSLPLFRCNPSRKSCSAKVVASQRILVGAKQGHSVKPSWPSMAIYLVPGSWPGDYVGNRRSHAASVAQHTAQV